MGLKVDVSKIPQSEDHDEESEIADRLLPTWFTRRMMYDD